MIREFYRSINIRFNWLIKIITQIAVSVLILNIDINIQVRELWSYSDLFTSSIPISIWFSLSLKIWKQFETIAIFIRLKILKSLIK